MSIFEILFAAFFCFLMVFALLGVLYVLMRAFSDIIKFVETKIK